MTPAVATTCPLCGGRFAAGEHCHAGCPLASRCALIRCPSCGYEFPDPARSRVAGWLARVLGRTVEGARR